MPMASPNLPSVPNPTFPRPSSNEPDYGPGEGQLAEQLFLPILKIFSWLYDYFFGIRPDLKASEVTKFGEKDITVLQAWCPPRYYTENMKLKCYHEITRHYQLLLTNWGNASEKSPHALCYSRFSNALEKDTKNKECRKALQRTVNAWIYKQTSPFHLGVPYDEMKESRSTLSHDFVVALCKVHPLPAFTALHINGPIEERDHKKLTKLILKINTLTELHFNVQKSSAQFFLHLIPFLLEDYPSITNLSLRNLTPDSTFVVQDIVWIKLSSQQNCSITFFNIPKMPDHFSSDKLTFKVE